MTHPNPYPRCIFCDAKADSREHAIPKWMSKRLGIKDQLAGLTGNLPPRRQPISFASHRARIFCKPCNTHFKHLEDAVIPLIVPMAMGRVISLGEENRALLALWASKTAMALIAATKGFDDLVPQEHRDSVRNAGTPPEQSWVGYLPWRGRTQLYAADSDLTLANVDPLPGHHSYNVFFSFKRLAFTFVGFVGGIPPGCAISRHPSSFAREFWPRAPGLIHWPPVLERPATDADMSHIIRFAPLRLRG